MYQDPSTSAQAVTNWQPTPLRVRLVQAFDQPYNNAVATARTCYASRIITSADVCKDERARAHRDSIASSTFAAGHHTILQHAHFQFTLEGISRQCIWSFLHSHPFYNSEQVSQRYVAVRPGACYVAQGLSPAHQTLYLAAAERQMRCYSQLIEALTPACQEAYFRMFPARRKQADKHASAIKKRAQETARAVLPIATLSHLYHTISGLTLHRYHRLGAMWDVPAEIQQVVSAMVEEVRRYDPDFFSFADDPCSLEETPEQQLLTQLQHHALTDVGRAKAFVAEFEARLAGKSSCLLGWTANGPELLADGVRCVLGLPKEDLSAEQALALLFDPKKNPRLCDALNLLPHGKLTRALALVHFTFGKKLSHAADSQEQRHRLLPGARPLLHRHYQAGCPDVIVPTLVAQVPAALELFQRCMEQTWQTIDTLLDGGVAVSDALYLLPNAVAVRFTASGDLGAWYHKWTTRLCYNAQEEIWRSSLDEWHAVQQIWPQLAKWILPPCGVRQLAAVRPLCPEGPRYCGVPVWKQQPQDFQRVL